MTLLYIYLAGVFVTLVLLGAWKGGGVANDDIVGAWLIGVAWPIVAMAIALAILCHGPFWLGTQLRKLFE